MITYTTITSEFEDFFTDLREEKAYAIIYGFCQDSKGDCHYSMGLFQKKLHCCENTARATLDKLKERGLIAEVGKEENGIKHYRAYPLKNCTPSKFEVDPLKICGTPPQNLRVDNKIDNKEINNTTTTTNNAHVRVKIKDFILDNIEALRLQFIRVGVNAADGVEVAAEPLIDKFTDWMIEIGQDDPDRLSRVDVKTKWRNWLQVETKKQNENVQQRNTTGSREPKSNNDWWADLAKRMGE